MLIEAKLHGIGQGSVLNYVLPSEYKKWQENSNHAYRFACAGAIHAEVKDIHLGPSLVWNEIVLYAGDTCKEVTSAGATHVKAATYLEDGCVIEIQSTSNTLRATPLRHCMYSHMEDWIEELTCGKDEYNFFLGLKVVKE